MAVPLRLETEVFAGGKVHSSCLSPSKDLGEGTQMGGQTNGL